MVEEFLLFGSRLLPLVLGGAYWSISLHFKQTVLTHTRYERSEENMSKTSVVSTFPQCSVYVSCSDCDKECQWTGQLAFSHDPELGLSEPIPI